jgi:hypothetical protein
MRNIDELFPREFELGLSWLVMIAEDSSYDGRVPVGFSGTGSRIGFSH